MPDNVISHVTKGRVAVINPQGKAVTIPEEQLSQALDFGYKTAGATDALHKAELNARLEADYGGATGMIHAASAGAARGFTLGASDYLFNAMGREEEARIAKERNAGLATAGELGAIGVSLLAGTGEARAASLLSNLGRTGKVIEGGLLLPRTVARLGEGVAAGTETLVGTGGGLLARAGRKGLQMAAQGGIEGAIYGLGHANSEIALGNPDMTAEKIMSEVGHGALLGGGLGGVLGAGGEFAGSGLRALAGLVKKRVPVGAVDDGTMAVAGTRAGSEGAAVAEGKALATGEQRIGDELAATGGGGEMSVRMEPGNAGEIQRDLLLAQVKADPARYFAKADDVAEKAAASMAPVKDVVDSGLAHLKPLMDGEGKRGIAKVLTEGMDSTAAIEESRNMLTRVRGAIEDTQMRNPNAYKPDTIKKLLKSVDDVESDLAKIAEGKWVSGPGHETADAFIRMDQFKQKLGKLASKSGAGRDSASKTALQSIYDSEAKELLENPKLWGGMAEYQSAVNPNYSRDIGLSGAAGEMRTATGERATYNAWVNEMLNDPGKLKGVLAKAGDVESQMQIKALLSHAENRVQLLEMVQKHAPMSEGQSAIVAQTRDAAAKVRDIIRDTTDQIQAIKQVQRLEQSKSNMLADAAAHIPVVGGGVSAVLRTDALSISRKAYAIQKFASAADQKLGLSLRSYVDSLLGVVSKSGTAVKATGAASEVTRKVAQAVVDTTRRGAGAATRVAAYGAATRDYEKRRESIMQAVANPQATADRIATAVAPFADAAPNVAASLTANVMRSAQYLASIAPSPPPKSSITPATDRWTPAQDDIDRWNRAFDVIDKGPSVVVDQLRKGRLIKEEVDALAVSHPNELNRIKTIIFDQVNTLDAKGKPIPYEAKLQLGTLFSFAADPSQEPATQMEIQATYATPKTAIGKQITQGGAAKLDAKRFGSATDSIEEGLS